MKRAQFENLPGQIDLEEALLEEMFERHEAQAEEYFHHNEPAGYIVLESEDDPIDDEDEGDDEEYYDRQLEVSEEIGIVAAGAEITRRAKDLFNRAMMAGATLTWEDLDDQQRDQWRELAVS